MGYNCAWKSELATFTQLAQVQCDVRRMIIIIVFLNLFPNPAMYWTWRAYNTVCGKEINVGSWSLENFQPLCWHSDSVMCAPKTACEASIGTASQMDKRWKNGSKPSDYFQINTAKEKWIPLCSKIFPVRCSGQSLPARPPSSLSGFNVFAWRRQQASVLLSL